MQYYLPLINAGRSPPTDGKPDTTDSLDIFFNFFGPERTEKMKGICFDMWPAFIKAVKAKAPNCTESTAPRHLKD